MKILGIETSCDETSVAIVEDGTKIISHVLATSLEIQQQYGGIVPEVASRKQAEYMIPVLHEAIKKRGLTIDEIDAIGVTVGPGLMGSLMVGLETAKTLSYIWQKPLIPVNHLIGHIYSGWLDSNATIPPQFPLMAVVASGGHTDVVLMHDHGQIELLGATRDDAIGEAFDKVARLLDLPYPGGPQIEKLAQQGDPRAFDFPRPLLHSQDIEFSYSGLKTAVLYETKKIDTLTDQIRADLAASFQQAAFETLVIKTMQAAKRFDITSLLLTGGVAANQYLKSMFISYAQKEIPHVQLYTPPLSLATDNATYIAAAAYFTQKASLDPKINEQQLAELEPNPSLLVTDQL
ncbi:tRNA (adenosine(37)-N6)-threonylcarbamoyltransferase complex transferase subunit TsaD [candidate division WWE3 bacterium]|nr:tRNA (adenosine(37)-N6)-threonylcarbamoyltransferase complex transferase subunit TsaD [candidate division WWE3 bacterium]